MAGAQSTSRWFAGVLANMTRAGKGYGMLSNVVPFDFKGKQAGGKHEPTQQDGIDLDRERSGCENLRRGLGGWVFLFPAGVAKDGGYLAQRRFAKILDSISKYDECCDRVSLCRYYLRSRLGWLNEVSASKCGVWEGEDKDKGTLASDHLDNLLAVPAAEDRRVYCIHYGPHIKQLLEKLNGRRVVYFAHSTGWKIDLPAPVPIVSVSKHCLGYWSKHAPSNPQFYLPNLIERKFCLPENEILETRPIDVLVIRRKMSHYLIHELVPILKQSLKVKVVDAWDGDIERLMQQSKVFLYDSSGYWKTHGATEGFGLPPLEAMACGCSVFSSVNDGLADFLEPGVNCQQLHSGSVIYDASAILKTVKAWRSPISEQPVVAKYRENAIRLRLRKIVSAVAH